MTTLRATREAVLDAPAPAVWAVLADFNLHHPAILPPAFSRLVVEEGGVGDGTVFRCDLTLGGRTRTFRARVSTPDPGRVLVESLLSSRGSTRFLLTPLDSRTRVLIESEFEASPGIAGIFERFLAPRFLENLYAEELRLLEARARTIDAPSAV